MKNTAVLDNVNMKRGLQEISSDLTTSERGLNNMKRCKKGGRGTVYATCLLTDLFNISCVIWSDRKAVRSDCPRAEGGQEMASELN